MTFHILTVCTGNICRSPQAAQLLRAAFAEKRGDVEISSAGTFAKSGQAMPPEAAELSREFGGDPDSHSAMQLTRELVMASDLVLTMARDHRAAVARLIPAASRRTFTILEFNRILKGVKATEQAVPEAGDFAGWLTRASERRGYFGGTSDADDVIDPYRRSAVVYRRSIEQIAPAVETFVGLIL